MSRRVVIREYVSLRPTGVEIEDFDLLQALTRALEQPRKRHRLSSDAIIVKTPEEIDDALLDRDEILQATGGKLPALWVVVNYYEGEMRPEDFAELERELDLKRLGTAVQESP